MVHSVGPARQARALVVVLCVLTGVTSGTASAQVVAADEPAPLTELQISTQDFLTGVAQRAWEHWSQAMQAVLDRNEEAVEAAFGALLALEPSPFRIALLADRTVERTAAGGALMLLQQDAEAGALGPNAQRIVELLAAGREQVNQADDGWYFCQIGRFDVANANFEALLAGDPDPVALLEFVDLERKRLEVLIQVLDNPLVGDDAREILALLQIGEQAVKADPTRVQENIERLGGPPRGYENACAALQDSGEYAVPFMIQYLQDQEHRELWKSILRCLPQLDRAALNPLVMALRMNDPVTKRYAIEALGAIGYGQAVPYLLRLRADARTPQELLPVIDEALGRIRAQGGAAAEMAAFDSAAQAFFALAEQYYDDRSSLAADPRLDVANVWYWREGVLQNVAVPTPIFNEVMAMRCCEEALLQEPGMQAAISLWLAANFRRAAQLPGGALDPTRPENNPPPNYFAEAAGAEYCLHALARGLDNGDPAVALGTIAALHKTAGPAALLAYADDRLPLAEALAAPNRMVRVRAGLTLGHARPTEAFQGHQNLMPVLVEALMLHGGAQNALIVDPDDASANAVAAVLRERGYTVLTDANLFSGLTKVRETLPGIDVIVLASNVREPALEAALTELRSDFRFAATPVLLLPKPGDGEKVVRLAQADYRLVALPQQPEAPQVTDSIAAAMRAVGSEAITRDLGAALALEATEVLRGLAVTHNPLFDLAAAQNALLATLETNRPDLRLAVVDVLGYLGSTEAQQAIAAIALDEVEPVETRIHMFEALARAAKRRGNLLPEETVRTIVTAAEGHADMQIRTAAAQTLGALNVAGEPASEIIRNQYQG